MTGSGGGGTAGGRRGSYILKEVSRTGEWELVREKVLVDPWEGGLKVLGEGGGIPCGGVEVKGRPFFLCDVTI